MTTIDTLTSSTKVVDGTGNSWFYGDVAIQGDLVLEVASPGCIPLEPTREVVMKNSWKGKNRVPKTLRDLLDITRK